MTRAQQQQKEREEEYRRIFREEVSRISREIFRRLEPRCLVFRYTQRLPPENGTWGNFSFGWLAPYILLPERPWTIYVAAPRYVYENVVREIARELGGIRGGSISESVEFIARYVRPLNGAAPNGCQLGFFTSVSEKYMPYNQHAPWYAWGQAYETWLETYNRVAAQFETAVKRIRIEV